MIADLAAVEAAVTAGLRTARFGRPLVVRGLVTSTNDLARDLASSGAEEGTAVLALEQSRGRGRLGRTWASPPGGLYLSVVLRPGFAMERWPLIGLACSLGAAAAAAAHARAEVQVKWPNDLILDERKLGGLLVEVVGGAAVCGIGINVVPPGRGPTGPTVTASRGQSTPTRSGTSPLGQGAPVDGPPDMVMPPDTVWLAERNPDVSMAVLARDVLFECERRYVILGTDSAEILSEWRAKAVTLGRMVRVEAPQPFTGLAEDIDSNGALLVRTSDGLRRVVAGDLVTIARSGLTRQRH